MAIKKSSPGTASRRPTKSKKPNKRRASSKTVGPSDPSKQRLNKVLAAAGLGSRREVEELIVQGRVEIDREIVTDLSCKVDPRKVTIKVDGLVLKQERLVYYALNKPTGVLSTNRDPGGRMRVIDLVPGKERVFSVGRLDRSSEGLILLTNDGELAQRLAHPKFAVQKAYFVVVSGVMDQEELNKLRKGVHLAEGFARIDGATIRRQRARDARSWKSSYPKARIEKSDASLPELDTKWSCFDASPLARSVWDSCPSAPQRQLNPTEVKALYAVTQKPAAKKPAGKPPERTSASKSESAAVYPEAIADDDDEFEMDMDDEGFSLLGDQLSDDDFVGHFSSSTAGSVLGYDDDDTSTQKPKATAKKHSSPRGKKAASKRGASPRSGGTPSRKTASPRADGRRAAPKPAVKKAARATRRQGNKPGKPAGGGNRKPSRSSGKRASGGKGSKGR